MKSTVIPQVMRRFSTLFGPILVSALMSLLGQPARAATLVVGNCAGPPFYSTIQDAVDASSAGDQVNVCPNTYHEQVVITHTITLTGLDGLGPVVILPPSRMVNPTPTSHFPQIFVFQATGVTISHLTVDGTGNGVACGATTQFLIGIYYFNASGTASGNTVENQNFSNGTAGQFCGRGIGIRVFNNSGSANVSVKSNKVTGYDLVGILGEIGGTNVAVWNNYVDGPGNINVNTVGIQLDNGAQGRVTGNTVNNNSALNGGFAATGIFAADAPGVQISDNSLTNNGNSISFETFTGSADGGKATENSISQSGVYGIFACSGNDTIKENRIRNSGTAGVVLVSIPGGCQASGARVEENVISTACAGILINPGVTGAEIEENNISNTKFRVLRNATSCH